MSSAFPTGWHVLSGALGTDVQVSSGVELSGGVAVHFPSTASATAIVVSDWLPVDDVTATGGSDVSASQFVAQGNFRASRINASDNLRFTVEYANKTKSSSTQNTVWASDIVPNTGEPLQVTNQWVTLGQQIRVTSATRYFRFRIERTGAIDFDLYCDSVLLRRLPPGFRATYSGGATAFPTSWGTVVSPLSFDVNASHQYTDSSGTVTLHQPGLYAVHASAESEDTGVDGNVLAIRIGWTRDSTTGTGYICGSNVTQQTAWNPGAGEAWTLTASGHVLIYGRWAISGITNLAGTVWMELAQLNGAAVNYHDARLSAYRVNDI